MKVYIRKALCICLIFFNDLGEFIQLDEFVVNLPFTTVLGLKKVICLHINANYYAHKQFPLLPASINILQKNNKEVYNVFIQNIVLNMNINGKLILS